MQFYIHMVKYCPTFLCPPTMSHMHVCNSTPHHCNDIQKVGRRGAGGRAWLLVWWWRGLWWQWVSCRVAAVMIDVLKRITPTMSHTRWVADEFSYCAQEDHTMSSTQYTVLTHICRPIRNLQSVAVLCILTSRGHPSIPTELWVFVIDQR